MAKTTLTNDEKQARDRVRRTDLAQRLTDAVKALQTSEDFKKLLRWSAAFTTYSPRNMLLIWSQRPDASQVAGFHTWRTLGRTVKKGSKGIMIYAPRVKKAATEGEADAVYFGVEHVFAFEDTAGDAPPLLRAHQLDGDDPTAAYARLVAFAEQEGLRVTQTPTIPVDDGTEGYYSPKERVIFVREAAPAHQVSVVAHEVAHYLDRDHMASREEKETIAEAVSFMVCATVGIDSAASAFPYIATWTAKEGGETIILKCLGRIQQIAKVLIDAIQPAEATESRTI